MGVTALMAVIALAGVVSIVVGQWDSSAPPSAVPAGSGVSASPPALVETPTPGATTAPPGEWAPASLPPIVRVADLAVVRAGPGGASPGTTFRLTSLTGLIPVELAQGVEFSPPFEFAVVPGDSPTTALLQPTAPLSPGTTYRATLRLADRSVAGSWVFQTGRPPRIASTLPGDSTTGVPIDTGIEITFDQDGVGDITPFFSITPGTPGRFEQHGRTAVFVPEALEPGTLYTITVRRGVPLQGADLALEDDFVFAFETAPVAAASATPKPEPWVAFSRALAETGAETPPILELGAEETVKRVDLRIHRFATMADAIDAFVTIRSAPDWAHGSDVGLVPVGNLTEIARLKVEISRWPSVEGAWASGEWVQLPDPLDAGWYLVTIPRRDRDQQMVLQVTDVVTTTIVASDRTLVWANDLGTGSALAGASVQAADGTVIGTTDADGLMLVPTPGRLVVADLVAEPRSGIVAVVAADGFADGQPLPGRAAFMPVAAWSAEVPFEYGFWRLLYTDRSLFRQTDTIEAWGVLRPRDGSRAPSAELRLVSGLEWWDEDAGAAEPVARTPVTPDPRTGVFAESIEIERLPLGDYVLGLWVGDHRVAGTALRVGTIRKPAYQLEVSTDRHVVVAGDTLTATVTASFFDGTRVPGLEIALSGVGSSGKTTTGPSGTASLELRAEGVLAPSDEYSSRWGPTSVIARPTGPEEGDISGTARVLAFQSRVVIDGEARISGSRLTIQGSLHQVDLERLEREQREGYEGEVRPQGAPVDGATVTAEITEHWSVRTRTGRGYDFISKQAFDIFSYEHKEKRLSARPATTDAAGRFRITLSVSAGHWFDLILTAADAEGRKTSLDLWAQRIDEDAESARRPIGNPTLGLSNPRSSASDVSWAVGDEIRATITTEEGRPLDGSGYRFLFYAARPGSLAAWVQTEPTFSRIFQEEDVPSIAIGGAWFNGATGGTTWVNYGCGAFLPAADARVDVGSRRIAVALTADAARYRPGGTVKLAVRTTDVDGRPAQATVVLRAIDEKLYAAGAALEPAADELYWTMPGEAAIASVTSSHAVPIYAPNEGDTCGPGVFYHEDLTYRDDFRDTLLFRRVTTDERGQATVSFDLSDDLTSWRVSATAFDARLFTGQTSLQIPVGLPFFIETSVAPDFLAGERPVLRLRAYGDALREGDRVVFTVTAPSLGMGGQRIVGTAFETTPVLLPELAPGDHQLRISASSGSGRSSVTDRLVREIRVVETRFTQRRTVVGDLADGLPNVTGSGLVTYVFTDAGRGGFIATLESLASGGGARVDQALAAALAQALLVREYGVDPGRFSGDTDLGRFQVGATAGDDSGAGGIALLPYASADLMLTARVALIAGDEFDGPRLRQYLSGFRSSEEATREAQNIALAGLAGLGDPVLPEIQAALADPDLTTRERLYLALGAASLGDDTTALAVERDLLATLGERLGPWLRLRAGSTLDDTIEATALMAVVGAMIGDPVAEWAEAYLEENRALDDLFVLQQIGYISAALQRLPASDARISYSLGGSRRSSDIRAGESFSLALTPAQASGFSAQTIRGRVVVGVSWDEAVEPARLGQDPALTLTRVVVPSGPIRSDQLVEVTLTARFGPQAVGGCYAVVDILPSGLAPLWGDEQRLEFCLAPDVDRADSVTYRARVVTPGTFIWEPAIAQSVRAPQLLALTESISVQIR